jgi:hypothetical protein
MKRVHLNLMLVAALATIHAARCADAPRTGMPQDPLIAEDNGVRRVVNYAPQWSPGVEWTVDQEPTLSIGLLDGPEEYLFDRIRGVTRLSDGTVVVLNSGAGQLRYYTPDGQYLRSVSRDGDGPGEMRGGRWLDRLEDDVVQVTHTGGRLRYGPDGSLVADERLDWGRIHELSRAVGLSGSSGFLTEACGLPTPLFLGDSVLLCASTHTDVRFLPDEAGVHQSVSLVAHADWPLLRAVDTLGVFHTRSLIMHLQRGRRHTAFLDPPYGPEGRMRVAGTPPKFIYTPADVYRIERYELDGPERRLVIERFGALRPPTALESGSFDRAFRGGAVSADPSSFRRLVTPVDSLSIIAAAPFVDATNAVWAPLEVPPQTFDVFDEDGVYLGQVTLPVAEFAIHEIGSDYILGVATGDFDAEYVQMLRLDRRAPTNQPDSR